MCRLMVMGRRTRSRCMRPISRSQDSDVTNSWRGRSCMMLGDTSAGAAVRPVIRGNRFHECGSKANGNKDHGDLRQPGHGWSDHRERVLEQRRLRDPAVPQRPEHRVLAQRRRRRRLRAAAASSSAANPRAHPRRATPSRTTSSPTPPPTTSSPTGAAAPAAATSPAPTASTAVAPATSAPPKASAPKTTQAPTPIQNRAAHDYRLKPGSDCLAIVGYDTAAL